MVDRERLETVIAFPAFDFNGDERRKRPPTNVLPMAACVEEQGVSSVRVIDGESLGLSAEDLTEEILANRPQIVGISVYTPSYPTARELVARVKAFRPEVVTVFGGKHPTHRYWEVLEDKNVDFVVVGEGEEVLKRLVAAKAIYANVEEMQAALFSEPGIGFRGRGFVPLAKRVNLKELPPINWRVLYPGLEFYLQSQDNFLIESSRGCFGHCVFCLAAGYRKGISFKPPEQFLGEMKLLFNSGFKRFFLTDDDAMANFGHINGLFERIKAANLPVKLEVNVRADSLLKCARQDGQFLTLAKEAGLTVLHVGVESGSPEILEYCRKGIDLSQVEEGVRLATQEGLIVESNFIVGFPYDNERTIRESITFALKLRRFGLHLPHVSIFMPYPGTQAYDDAVREGLLDPRSFDLTSLNVHRGAVIPTKFLSTREVEVLYEEFYEELYPREFMHFLKKGYPGAYDMATNLLEKRLK